MSKILYHYDPKTGLLISTSEAQKDVRSSDPNRYIIPINATFAEPPVVQQLHRVARFDTVTNSWTVVDDFRKMTVYNKTTKDAVVWSELGNLPREYTFKAYDEDLKEFVEWNGSAWVISEDGRERLLDIIWSIRKRIREAECSSDLEYNGHMIHVDAISFNDIMLAAQEAIYSGDMTTSKRWVTADNLDVQLNGHDFVAIAKLFGVRRQRLVYESNEAWQQDTFKSNDELVELYREMQQRG